MPPPFFLRKNYIFMNKASSTKNLASEKFNYYIRKLFWHIPVITQ